MSDCHVPGDETRQVALMMCECVLCVHVVSGMREEASLPSLIATRFNLRLCLLFLCRYFFSSLFLFAVSFWLPEFLLLRLGKKWPGLPDPLHIRVAWRTRE